MSETDEIDLRTLVRLSPQAFVNLGHAESQYVEELSEELENRVLERDVFVEVALRNEPYFMDFVLQTTPEPDLPLQLVCNNASALVQFDLVTLGIIIDALPGEEIRPTELHLPDGIPEDATLSYYYRRIQLVHQPPEFILDRQAPGLLPFLPFTKGGATQEMVLRMLDEMKPYANPELERIGLQLAAVAFTNTGQQREAEWLKERFYL